jgi:hypothetical protein
MTSVTTSPATTAADASANVSADTQVIWSVQQVRRVIGLIAVSFPFVLVLGGLLFDREKGTLLFRDALSDYYYSRSLHYVFLVAVVTLGLLLIYYQYHEGDNVATTVAGLLGMGVALFRPAPVGATYDPVQTTVDDLHHTCAVLFLATLAYISIFLFTKPEAPFEKRRKAFAGKIPSVGWLHWFKVLIWSEDDDIRKTPLYSQKQTRNRVYIICGIVIVICLAVLIFINRVLHSWPPSSTLVFESIALWSFALTWFVKGEAIPHWNDKDLVAQPASTLAAPTSSTSITSSNSGSGGPTTSVDPDHGGSDGPNDLGSGSPNVPNDPNSAANSSNTAQPNGGHDQGADDAARRAVRSRSRVWLFRPKRAEHLAHAFERLRRKRGHAQAEVRASYAELWQLAPAELNALEWAFDNATHYLRGKPLAECHQRILDRLEVAADLKDLPSDAQRETTGHERGEAHADGARRDRGDSRAARIATLSSDARQEQDFVRREAIHRAAGRYAIGLIIGVLLTFVLLPFIAWLSLWVATKYLSLSGPGNTGDIAAITLLLQYMLVCIGGGAIGATVSALLLLRAERINYQTNALLAAVQRVAFGWLFAAAIVFLIKSGVVQIFTVPNETTEPIAAWFFWGALGFLAGFNAAWVPDLATRGKGDASKGLNGERTN